MLWKKKIHLHPQISLGKVGNKWGQTCHTDNTLSADISTFASGYLLIFTPFSSPSWVRPVSKGLCLRLVLWELCRADNITHLVNSPKYIQIFSHALTNSEGKVILTGRWTVRDDSTQQHFWSQTQGWWYRDTLCLFLELHAMEGNKGRFSKLNRQKRNLSHSLCPYVYGYTHTFTHTHIYTEQR